MIKFHAVMIDETGCEFGVSFEADSFDAASDALAEDYPESRIDELRTIEGWAEKERLLWERVQRECDGDGEPEEDLD